MKRMTDPDCIARVQAVRDRSYKRLVDSVGEEEADRMIGAARDSLGLWEKMGFVGKRPPRIGRL